MAINPMGDFIMIGGTSGAIYALDSTLLAHDINATGTRKESITSKILGKELEKSVSMYSTLEGHSRKVTGLAFSIDNCTMVSGSEDGSVRVWDLWTKQCVREFKALNNCGITSILVSVY
jgi:WD40 repeat protein